MADQIFTGIIGNYLVTLSPPIGGGTFGSVHLASDTQTGTKAAVKQIRLLDGGVKNEWMADMAKRELGILKELKTHPHVVQLYQYETTPSVAWIVMEYCDLNNLKIYLKNNPQSTLFEKITIFDQCASAVSFMHGQNPPIIHRDLKLENILMKREGDDDVIKIADFGLSKFLDEKKNISVFHHGRYMSTTCGSEYFMAPELSAEFEGGVKYDSSIDVFALGLAFLVIFQHGPDKMDLIPLSVQSMKMGACISIGKEMMKRYMKDETLPEIIEYFETDCSYSRRVKRIISYMAKFKPAHRKNIQEVYEETSEMVHAIRQGTKSQSNQSGTIASQTGSDRLTKSLEGSFATEKEMDTVSVSEMQNQILSEEISELKNALKTKETETLQIKEDLDELSAEIQQLKVDNSMLGTFRQELTVEIEELQLQRDNYENSSLELSQRLNKANAEIQTIRDQLHKRKIENEELSIKLDHEISEKKTTEIEIKKLKSQIDFLQRNNIDLKKDKHEVITDIQNVKFETKRLDSLHQHHFQSPGNLFNHRASQEPYWYNKGARPKDHRSDTQRKVSASDKLLPDTKQNIRVIPPPVKTDVQCELDLHRTKCAFKTFNKTEHFQNEDIIIIRQFRSILNKLTPQQFQTLVAQLLQLPINSELRVKHAADIMFDKAIDEPCYTAAYAHACAHLSKHVVAVTEDKKRISFKRVLLNRCQQEFQNYKLDKTKFKAIKAIEAATNEEKKNELKENFELAIMKATPRYLGTIKFIAELSRLQMLTEKIMHECTLALVKSQDEQGLEGLCIFLSTIGKLLDVPKDQTRMDQYCRKIQAIVDNRQTSTRMRFMLMNIIELRANKWVPRGDRSIPMTINLFHRT